MRALVTAGGTSEPIDDVRVITNVSTGRFGAAIANALAARGIDVTLLASAALARHPGWIDPRVRVTPFRTYADLDHALTEALASPPDLLFMAAAVSDYAPVPASGKIPSSSDEITLTLRRTPKILATLRPRCGPGTLLVGFKLLSSVTAEALIEVARRQVASNGLDLCLANDLSELQGDRQGDRHPAFLVPAEGPAVRIDGTKAEVADQLVQWALQRRPPSGPAVDLGALLPGDPIVHQRGTDHRGAEALFARHPTIRALVHLTDALVLPSSRTSIAWTGDPADAVAIGTALAREAWAGGWRGGGFSIRLGGGGALAGLTDADLEELPAQWRSALGGWTEAIEALQLDPEAAAPRPVWHGPRVIGVHAAMTTPIGPATAVWLRPEVRRQGTGDRLFEHLSTVGRRAWSHADLGLADWFAARGWIAVHEAGPVLVLEPPSARRDLKPAASVCLIDPVRRRVLLGRRCTTPWQGYWAFPGGSRHGQETVLQNALRELAEETGLVVPEGEPLLTTHVVVGADPGFDVVNVVLPVFDPPDPRPTPELDARWFHLDDVAGLAPMTAGTRRILGRLVAEGVLR